MGGWLCRFYQICGSQTEHRSCGWHLLAILHCPLVSRSAIRVCQADTSDCSVESSPTEIQRGALFLAPFHTSDETQSMHRYACMRLYSTHHWSWQLFHDAISWHSHAALPGWQALLCTLGQHDFVAGHHLAGCNLPCYRVHASCPM